MKMTWKNQSKKNPNKRPIYQFENLPFDPTDDSTFPEEKLPKNEEISNVNGDDDDNDTIKLVESCQQQGNKLAEAWVTLGRAQLNYGEPDSAIESLDRALAIKPDSAEARNDRQAALHHIQRRKQLQTSGLSMNPHRFSVVDQTEST
ncbi:hypothetical protein KY285_022324 [Solanum tuberosum]|nr:hypothetical protein KY285_022324 [Solanum tuberosum]